MSYLRNLNKIKELNDYVAKNAEYVGDNFVSEVRSIHYDKKKKRNIYGNATFEETRELQEEGIDAKQWLENPQFNEPISRVVARLLNAADQLYKQAELGISDLPWDCRPAIQAARLIYAEIGREVERLNLDSVSARAVVSKQRKLVLLTHATSAIIAEFSIRRFNPEAHPSIQFLIDAVIKTPHIRHYGGTIYERLTWVVDLLERVEERKREAELNTADRFQRVS